MMIVIALGLVLLVGEVNAAAAAATATTASATPGLAQAALQEPAIQLAAWMTSGAAFLAIANQVAAFAERFKAKPSPVDVQMDVQRTHAAAALAASDKYATKDELHALEVRQTRQFDKVDSAVEKLGTELRASLNANDAKAEARACAIHERTNEVLEATSKLFGSLDLVLDRIKSLEADARSRGQGAPVPKSSSY